MFLIILTLFLCQMHFYSGHAIPVIENNHETANIYELNENNSTAIRIAKQKSEMPKLTEIIYYHIIEKPYGYEDVSVEESKENEANSDETRKPFTNGHGYQFLKSGEETVENDEVHGDGNKETSNYGNAEEDIVTEVIYYDDHTEEVKADNDTATPIDPTTAKDKSIEEILLEEEATTVIPDISTVEANMTIIDADVMKKKLQERNQLFNNVKNKYQELVRHDKLIRRKRNIGLEEIPEAPVLPELDYSILPDSIREQIETALTKSHRTPETENQTEEHIPQIDKETVSDEDEEHDNFEENFDQLFNKWFHSVLNDNDRGDITVEEQMNDDNDSTYQDNENPEDIRNDSDDAANFGEGETQRQVPRTYGMSINGDSGYVWNDLYNNPGIYFNVGSDADKHENGVKPQTIEPETPEIPETLDNTNQADFEDIHVNTQHIHSNPHTEKSDHAKETVDKHTKSSETHKKLQTETEHDSHYGEEIKEENIDVRHGFDDDDIKIRQLKEKYNKLEDILKNYIKRLIKEEIVKNKNARNDDKIDITKTEKYYETTEKGASNNVESKTSDKELSKRTDEISKHLTQNRDTVNGPTNEENTIIIDGKEIPITHATNFNDDVEAGGVEPTLKRRKHKNNTIIHSRPSNKTEHKEINRSNSIKAMNIYGNSMNNERVTNVYVFIKSLDTQGIEALKPIITGSSEDKSSTNTLVVENADKIDVSTNTDSKIEEQRTEAPYSETTSTKPTEDKKVELNTETSTSTESKDIITEANIESKKPSDKIESISTTESPKESTTELNKNEVSKEILEPQKSEETNKLQIEKKTESKVTPESDKNEEPKKSEEEELSDNTKTIESKTKSSNIVPGSAKIEEDIESETTDSIKAKE